MDVFFVTITKVATSVPYFLMMAAAIFASKVLYEKTRAVLVHNSDAELTHNDNFAYGAHLGFYLLGVSIALSSLFLGATQDHLANMWSILIYAPITIVLMRLGLLINDKLVLKNFSVDDEIVKDRNLGTGFAVGGSSVASGLILAGALSGESVSYATGIRDLAAYWAIGQVLLAFGAFVFQMITPFDFHQEIEDDNVSAGISYGGFVVGIGLVVYSALNGAGPNLLAEAVITLIIAVAGIVLLAVIRVVADRIILPSASLSDEIVEDRNVAAGIIAACMFVSLSWAYSASLIGLAT